MCCGGAWRTITAGAVCTNGRSTYGTQARSTRLAHARIRAGRSCRAPQRDWSDRELGFFMNAVPRGARAAESRPLHVAGCHPRPRPLESSSFARSYLPRYIAAPSTPVTPLSGCRFALLSTVSNLPPPPAAYHPSWPQQASCPESKACAQPRLEQRVVSGHRRPRLIFFPYLPTDLFL